MTVRGGGSPHCRLSLHTAVCSVTAACGVFTHTFRLRTTNKQSSHIRSSGATTRATGSTYVLHACAKPLPPFSSRRGEREKGTDVKFVDIHGSHTAVHTHKNSSSSRVNSSKEKGPRALEPCLPRPSPFPDADFPSEPPAFPIAPLQHRYTHTLRY